MSDQDERNRGTTGGFLLGCIVGGLVALGAGGGWVWVQRQHAQARAAEERIAAEQAALEAQRQAEKARQKPVPAKVDDAERMPKADE